VEMKNVWRMDLKEGKMQGQKCRKFKGTVRKKGFIKRRISNE